MPGKHSLYQRVLSVPGARVADTPGGEADTPVVPFTAFYVYARQQQDGREWIEVGTDRHGTRAGWLAGTDSISWNHGLTAVFRDPAGHDRVLLLRDSDSLRRLAGQDSLKTYKRLYKEAVQGNPSEDSPVVAIQPPGYIDIREDFYLLPIHRYEDVYLGSEKARLLQVSSVPLTGGAAAKLELKAAAAGLSVPAGPLLFLSATATTLLLGRFFWLIGRRRKPGSSARVRPASLAWLVLVPLAIWLPFSPLSAAPAAASAASSWAPSAASPAASPASLAASVAASAASPAASPASWAASPAALVPK